MTIAVLGSILLAEQVDESEAAVAIGTFVLGATVGFGVIRRIVPLPLPVAVVVPVVAGILAAAAEGSFYKAAATTMAGSLVGLALASARLAELNEANARRGLPPI